MKKMWHVEAEGFGGFAIRSTSKNGARRQFRNHWPQYRFRRLTITADSELKRKQAWRKEFLAEIRRMNDFIKWLQQPVDPRQIICHNFAFTPIDYRKGGDDVVKAYAKWRDERKGETHHAVSFVAGFNAARA